MTDLALNSTPLPPVRMVHADNPCAGCGYNLRGLTRDANCPECGTSVAISLRGNALWFSPPRWIGSLYNGALALFLASVIGLVQWVLYWMMRNAGPSGELRWDLIGLSCVALATSGFGVIMLTTREPRQAMTPASLTSAPGLARAVFVPYAIIWIVNLSLEVAFERDDWQVMRIVNLFGVAVGVTLLICLAIHVHRMARRMSRPGLGAMVWVYAILAAISRGIWFFTGLYMLVEENSWMGIGSFLITLWAIANWTWLLEMVAQTVFWGLLALALRKAKTRAERESQAGEDASAMMSAPAPMAPPPLPQSVSNTA